MSRALQPWLGPWHSEEQHLKQSGDLRQESQITRRQELFHYPGTEGFAPSVHVMHWLWCWELTNDLVLPLLKSTAKLHLVSVKDRLVFSEVRTSLFSHPRETRQHSVSCCIPLPDLIGSSPGNVYIKGGKKWSKIFAEWGCTDSCQDIGCPSERQIDQTKAVSGRPPGHQACNSILVFIAHISVNVLQANYATESVLMQWGEAEKWHEHLFFVHPLVRCSQGIVALSSHSGAIGIYPGITCLKMNTIGRSKIDKNGKTRPLRKCS